MPPSKHKTVIIIAGPTAAGKTAAAIQIAKHFQTEIISADSRQCFREMKIGVARPSDEELQSVKHHFIASHSVTEEITAASFESYALEKCSSLFAQHDHVVMVGGTGLYLRAFCYGLDKIPPVPAAVRQEIKSNYESRGLDWIQEQLVEKDPLFYKQGEILNPQRAMRALEVAITTGRSILSFRDPNKTIRDFKIHKIGLELPREILYERINARVDKMMDDGLLEEVRALMPYKHLNALQTVGYAELFEHLEGNSSLDRAVELIKQNTRRYAKRQMTWFRKEEDMNWFAPLQVKEIIDSVR
jgi:tRNA dimethylallyltransferase